MGNINLQQLNLNNTQVISETWKFDGLVAAGAMAGCAYLTPDSMMAYCQSRLQGIDTQVNEAFAKQQQSNYESSVLSKLLQDPSLAIPSDTLHSSDNPNPVAAKLTDAENAIKKAMANLDPSSPTYQALQTLESNIEGIHTDQDLSPQQFQSQVIDGVNNVQKDLNSSSELSMISLQSLMSQRQQAVQICTNLVQSLGDQCNKIAENVGH
jgi:hypothetical protein